MNSIRSLLFVVSLSFLAPLAGQTVIRLPQFWPFHKVNPLPGGWYINVVTTKPPKSKKPKSSKGGAAGTDFYYEHKILVLPWLIGKDSAGGSAFAHCRLRGFTMPSEVDAGDSDSDVWTFEVLFNWDEGYCDPKAGADAGVNFELLAWNSYKNILGNKSTPFLAGSYAANARAVALQQVKIRAAGADVAEDSDGVDVASTAQSGPITITYGRVGINLQLAGGWNKRKTATGVDRALVSLDYSESASAIFKSEAEVRADVKHTVITASTVEARAEAKGLSFANITLSSVLCEMPYPETTALVID